MKTFLTEEPEFKYLFLKLERVEGVPEDEEVLRITKEILTESETDEGDKWINHQ